MKKPFMKRAISILLIMLMVLEMVPMSGAHAHESRADHTDLSIDFNYQSQYDSAEEALKAEAMKPYNFSYESITEDEVFQEGTASHWNRVYDGDLKREGGKFRELMESSDPSEKYIVLTQDVELRYNSGEWKPIRVTSDKVLDLNGFTMTWWDMTNKEKGEGWQSENIYDHYLDKYFIYIREGATLTIIDSSAPVNGYNTGKGTGAMVTGAQIIDAYSNQLDYYTHRDLFVVDGNLVIYGGTFTAGRQKDQYKKNFTWDKLADCLGKTLDLGLSIAEYATGLDSAAAAFKDVKAEFANSAPANGNTSDSGETGTSDSATNKPTGDGGKENKKVDTPESAGPGNDSKARPQTVGERTGSDNADNSTNSNQTGGSAAQTGGKNESNAKGTAKNDKNSKIAAAEKNVVTAALDKNKITDMFSKGMDVIKSIASMLGKAEGTRVTQTIHGTVAKVNTSGTLVVYGGTFQGHGATPHVRNATIEVVRLGLHSGSDEKLKNDGGRAYIFGGTFEGYAGANIFNFVRAPKDTLTGVAQAFQYTATGHEIEDLWYLHQTEWCRMTINGELVEYLIEYPYVIELDASETNNMEVMHYENQDEVKKNPKLDPIPIDTSNVVVRGGTFRTYCELANEGTRLPYMKEEDPNGNLMTFVKFTGTSGSVNLGVESFGEDMIRDGRIQLVDVYGDGTLVLMDEEVDAAHPAGLKHYRLYCGDTELRHIRYLDVYPMNAGSNSTHSFALQTYYGNTNLSNISTWNTENDEENLHTAPFAGDEYFFDYEFDGRDARDYYVMPNLDGEMYDTGMQDSEAWYYPEPVDSKGNPIPDFRNTVVLANFNYKGEPRTAEVQSLHSLYIFEPGDYENFSTATYTRHVDEAYRDNLKWFRYRVYRVDPITRENISESDYFGTDEPLAEVVYGVAENEAMRCKLDLYDLSQYLIEKTKDTAKPWTGYKPGELYRIVFNVDEYVNFGYTGPSGISDTALSFKWVDNFWGDDWSVRNTYTRRGESYAGLMPVASTESSVLFRCSSVSEQAELPNTNASSNVFYDTDYTPLQFDTFAVMAGKKATVNFVNAKVSQADNAGNDFIDVYYQWYLSDDPIVDRDPSDPNKVTDELLAGMTNVCLDWNSKSDHKPEKWNPEADIYDYRNSLSPKDPNYEAYGEDGLPDNKEYWTMYDLHAYTTELRQNELCMKPGTSGNLTMQNNNPFAFNTDSCYIPEEAAGKYLYVKAVVVNAKEEYTKIYDKKQVFYSHPMLIIDSAMMVAETQQPDTDPIYQHGDTYHHASIEATVGEDLLFGFSATALPEDLKREGFEVRISQKVYDPYNAEEMIYEANNGDLINLKDYITEPGRYTVKQTQELYYKRPYWSWEINQFREALIKEEYVATRVDLFSVTIDLPRAESVFLDYPRTGFDVGDEITITAEVEPAGDWWYKWMLDDAPAISDMTVLQDSQSPVLKYTFTDEQPQRFWVAVYAKDKYGNSSVNPKYNFTEEIFPCDSIVPEIRYDGTVITEDRELRYIRVNEDPVNITVDVEGGSGNYEITAYKRNVKSAYYDTNLGKVDTITIDTSKTSTTDYWFTVRDTDAHEFVTSKYVRVVVTDWLDVTPFRTGTTTINKPTTMNLGASKVVGHDVTFTLERQERSLWVPVSDAVFDSDGKCLYTVQDKGLTMFRLTATDYYGDTQTFLFGVNYDDSVPQPVAADGSGKLMFRVKGTNEYKTVFHEGEDIEAFFTGGIDYDPGSPLYDEIRAQIKEELGLDIDPVADKVEISFKLLRYNNPSDAKIGASGGTNVYEEAGLELSYGSLQDITFDTASKMPEAPVSHIDGTHMTPGYYYASWWVTVVCNDDYFIGGGAGLWEEFTMTGAFEVVADGAEHVHDFKYGGNTIDEKTHYVECICGYREEGEHDFANGTTDYNNYDIPWIGMNMLIEVTDDGKYIYRDSGVEMRVCNTQWCWHDQYRWAYVEGLTLANETLEMGVNESTKMTHTVDFMEELDAQWLAAYPTYFSEEDIANFLPGNSAVTWTSSDESVATVDADGNITAVGSGTAIITATTVQFKYGGYNAGRISASCTVTVACDHPDIVPVAAKESTCSEKGCIAHYICNVCGTVSLDGTCTDGKTVEDVSLDVVAHAVSNVFGYNEEGHFRTCKYGCGYQFGAVTAHSYNVAEADCTTSKYCTRCKYVAEEAKSHSLIYMDAMEATCTDAGLNACYNCMDCGRYFLDAEGTLETTESKLNIRPLGHSWVDATCTDAKYCSRCGETEGAELGHNWSTATCENPKTCGRCGETEGAALGHSWEAATCVAPKTCSTCHKTEGNKLDHTYEDGYCSICGADDPSIITYTVTLMFGDSPVGWLSAEPGQPVGKPEDPAQEGMVFLGWFTENGDLFDFNTPITEDIALYAKFEDAPTLDGNIKIYHTLDLASDISITFAVPKTLLASYDSYYLECILPEYTGNAQTGTSTMIVQPVDKGSYYYFTLTGITAVRMGDMVDAILHMTKGDVKYISSTDQFSVATYAYNMLNTSKDSTMLTLCADLLRYGAEAQSYKKYRTDALVDAEMTETHRSYLSNTASLSFTSTDSFLGDLNSPTITWVGKTLDLGSKVGMKFVFNTTKYTGDLANLCMRVTYKGSTGDTKTVMLTDIEVYNAKNNYYAFTFYGLLASELRTVVDVAVFEKTTQLSESLRYSAETYAAKTGGTTLEALTRALFAYSDSAKAFFAK